MEKEKEESILYPLWVTPHDKAKTLQTRGLFFTNSKQSSLEGLASPFEAMQSGEFGFVLRCTSLMPRKTKKTT